MAEVGHLVLQQLPGRYPAHVDAEADGGHREEEFGSEEVEKVKHIAAENRELAER